MKKSRFSDSLVMAILTQAETRNPVPEPFREHEMSNVTFYNFRDLIRSIKRASFQIIHKRHTQCGPKHLGHL